MSLFRRSDYTAKKEVPKKQKIPTEMKTTCKFCRNCNAKAKNSQKSCVQCGNNTFMKRPYR